MDDSIRPDKAVARKFVIQFAPEYADMLRDLQRQGRWLRLPDELLNIRNHLKIHNYVELYDDERRIGVAMMLAFLGNDGLKELNSEVSRLSREEQCALLNELVQDGCDLDLSSLLLPKTEEGREQARKQFEQLPDDEKKELTKRAQLFWSFVFASFHSMLSVMIHGAKLTTLVSQAKAGEEDAFCKAIQIDRLLLSQHPFFRERRLTAQERGETEFLAKIAYRETNPTLRGKIRYPGLYMVFACLEAVSWLNEFKHEEILDLCDEAGLDRYQNRIEDVNYLTKRLREYRRMQKLDGVSMH